MVVWTICRGMENVCLDSRRVETDVRIIDLYCGFVLPLRLVPGLHD